MHLKLLPRPSDLAKLGILVLKRVARSHLARGSSVGTKIAKKRSSCGVDAYHEDLDKHSYQHKQPNRGVENKVDGKPGENNTRTMGLVTRAKGFREKEDGRTHR